MNTDFQDIKCKKINICEYLWKSVSKLIYAILRNFIKSGKYKVTIPILILEEPGSNIEAFQQAGIG